MSDGNENPEPDIDLVKYPQVKPKPPFAGGFSRLFRDHRKAMVERGLGDLEAGIYWALVAEWEDGQAFACQSVALAPNSRYVGTRDKRTIERALVRLVECGFVLRTRQSSKGRRPLWWPSAHVEYCGIEFDAALNRPSSPYGNPKSGQRDGENGQGTHEMLTRPYSALPPGSDGKVDKSCVSRTHEMLTRPYSSSECGSEFSEDRVPDPDHDHGIVPDPDLRRVLDPVSPLEKFSIHVNTVKGQEPALHGRLYLEALSEAVGLPLRDAGTLALDEHIGDAEVFRIDVENVLEGLKASEAVKCLKLVFPWLPTDPEPDSIPQTSDEQNDPSSIFSSTVFHGDLPHNGPVKNTVTSPDPTKSHREKHGSKLPESGAGHREKHGLLDPMPSVPPPRAHAIGSDSVPGSGESASVPSPEPSILSPIQASDPKQRGDKAKRPEGPVPAPVADSGARSAVARLIRRYPDPARLWGEAMRLGESVVVGIECELGIAPGRDFYARYLEAGGQPWGPRMAAFYVEYAREADYPIPPELEALAAEYVPDVIILDHILPFAPSYAQDPDDEDEALDPDDPKAPADPDVVAELASRWRKGDA